MLFYNTQISLKYGVFVIGIAFLEVGHSSKSQGHDIYKFYIFYQYASTVTCTWNILGILSNILALVRRCHLIQSLNR